MTDLLTEVEAFNEPNASEEVFNLELDLDNAFINDDIEEKVESCKDALLMSLNNIGKVDIRYISNITNKDKDEVLKDLKDLIYLDPVLFDGHDIYSGYVTKEEYLSGNIINKHKIAKEAKKDYPYLFDKNVSDLLKALPRKSTSGELYVTLGTPWLPTEIIEAFLKDAFHVYRHVSHDEYTGSWEIDWSSYCDKNIVKYTYGVTNMNALKIIEKTLNLSPIVIYKSKNVLKDGKLITEREIDIQETELAKEKQKAIIDLFHNWINSKSYYINVLENIYFNKFGCFVKRKFDGSFLTFPTMSPTVKLYSYQKNAVMRIILSPNTLLAHDVGSGKTYEMIAAGQELRRLKLSKKNMYVVPNGIIKQWEKIFYDMYPDANLLVISNKNFSPKYKQETLLKIRDNDYDGIIITYSCFSSIPLSPDFYIDQLADTKVKLDTAKNNKNSNTETVRRKSSNFIKTLDNKLDKIGEYREKTFGEIYFDELNINRLFIDEAHNFKNVPFDTKITCVLGLNPSGSKACLDMMNKVHLVQKQNQGKGVVLATGTPITNSVSDVYVIQKYLQDAEMAVLGIANFDAWVGMFSETSTDFEIDPTSTSFRLTTRLSKFHNLPELASLLSDVADFHHIVGDVALPEFNGYEDIVVEKSKEFKKFLEDISLRADLIRKKKPRILSSRIEINEKGVPELVKVRDNMLVITTDGRKAALDLRIIDEKKYHFNYESKVYKCALKVYELYRKYNDTLATQLIFSDISSPKEGFNVYDELKRILVYLGIPSHEVAFIHDAKIDKQKDALLNKVNEGEVRVLIGSTFKLGTGVNVQSKLIAIHHIDVPWRPSDMVQREGRILRPGNENGEIFIYRYITKNSFDAYSWQLLETKQRFISELLTSQLEVRDFSDVSDTVLNYAEVKALAVGDPLIKTRVETFNTLTRYRMLQSQSEEKRTRIEDEINYYLEFIPKIKENIELTEKDVSFVKDFDFKNVLKDKEYRKKIREEIFNGINESLANREEKEICEYCGFKVIGPSHIINNELYIYLQKESKFRLSSISNGVGLLKRIDNFIMGLDNYLKELKERLQKMEQFIIDGRMEINRNENYLAEIDKYTKLLEEIDKKLGVNKNDKTNA